MVGQFAPLPLPLIPTWYVVGNFHLSGDFQSSNSALFMVYTVYSTQDTVIMQVNVPIVLL